MQRCILIILCLTVDFINVNLSGLQFLNLQAEDLVASALVFLVNRKSSSHGMNLVTGFQQAILYSHIISFFHFLMEESIIHQLLVCYTLYSQLKIKHKWFDFRLHAKFEICISNINSSTNSSPTGGKITQFHCIKVSYFFFLVHIKII